MTLLLLNQIRRDGGTQPRAAIDFNRVREYAEDMVLRDAAMPPVTVFYDGTDYWLADGFHRWHAHEAAGRVEIDSDVRQGTQRDAILFSVGANAGHGTRRSDADKRRAVLKLLEDAKWSRWSDGEIARQCAVSQPFVSSLRPRPAVTHNVMSEAPRERTYTTKHGTVATMNTARIGGGRAERDDDRPVFDNTRMGGDVDSRTAQAEAPTSVNGFTDVPRSPADRSDTTPERQAQLDHTRTHGHIFSLIQEIDERVARLPAPQRCIADFPHDLRQAVSVRRLREIADWFAQLADEWPYPQEEETDVAA